MNKVLEAIFRLKDEFTGPLRGAENGVKGFTLSLGSLMKGVAALGLGAVLGKFFKDSVTEALAAEQSLGFLRTAVNNAGHAFSDWQPEIDKSIDSLTKLTKYGDDDFRAALTNMVSKSGDVKGSLANMSLAADIAAKKNIGLAEAGDLVGKAMTGNEKVFKEFGIISGTNAEKIEQLRERTRGYAETELNTLGGRLAQAKANFSELQESVGNMIVGSDGAREMAGRLSTAMADLATWISENREAGLRFVDSVFSMIQTVGQLLAPVWSLIVAMRDGVEATVGWGNIWRGLQIAMVSVAGTFGVLASAAKAAFGGILEAMGTLFMKGAPLLDKLGFAASETASSMIATGKRMYAEATRAAQEGVDNMKTKMLLIATATEVGQKQQVKAVHDGATARVNIVDAEAKETEAAVKKSHANLAALERERFKSAIALMNAQEREYLALVEIFNEKMKDMTDADHKRAEAALKETHANLLLKWAGFKAGVGDANDGISAKVVQTTATVRTQLAKWPITMQQIDEAAAANAKSMDRMLQKAGALGGEVANAANQLLDFADAIGASDSKMFSLVEGIGKLGDSLALIASGDVLGGLAAGVQGIQGVIGGLFGQSPEEKRLADELVKARHAIDQLRGRIGDLMNANTPGAMIAKMKSIDLTGVNRVDGEHQTKQMKRSVEFAMALGRQGLTVEDADKLMTAMTGERISRTDKGYFTAAAIQAFVDAMNASEFGQFAQDFEAQQEVAESIRRAQGTDTAGQGALDLIKNLRGEGGSTFLANFLDSLVADNGDISGNARSETAKLLTKLNEGGFDEANFGGLTGAQFVGAINTFIGYLGATASAPAVTAGVTVPTQTFGTAAFDMSGFVQSSWRETNDILADIRMLSSRIAESTDLVRDHTAAAAGYAQRSANTDWPTLLDQHMADTLAISTQNNGGG